MCGRTKVTYIKVDGKKSKPLLDMSKEPWTKKMHLRWTDVLKKCQHGDITSLLNYLDIEL